MSRPTKRPIGRPAPGGSPKGGSPGRPAKGTSTGARPSLMLVDDHPMWRETLRRILEHKRVGHIVAEASDGEEALELSRRARPDVVIMDIDLPAMDGVEATRRLLADRPDVKVLVLSAFQGRSEVVGAVRAGASGYLLKTAPSSEVADAVRRISSGELVLPPSLMEVVREELQQTGGADAGIGSPSGAVARRAGSERTADAPPVRNTFLLEGDFWTLAWGGEVARLTDSKGMGWIASLLRRPGREVHVLQLVGAGRDRQAGPAPGLGETGMHVGDLGDAGALLDPKAKAAYRARLEELRQELEEAQGWGDAERAARAREESEFIAQELAAAVGLGGRDRRAASAAERARVNVARAIKRAVKRIGGPHPSLARHLEKAIRTGIYCCYDPEHSTDWTL